MSNADYLLGQQAANVNNLWDTQQAKRVASNAGRRAAEWEAYAYELEAKLDLLVKDRDEVLLQWKAYADRLKAKLQQTEDELAKSREREAAATSVTRPLTL